VRRQGSFNYFNDTMNVLIGLSRKGVLSVLELLDNTSLQKLKFELMEIRTGAEKA
jgi:hypothetical protein